MSAAFDRRFLFVTGKGGVGKSLVSAALAARSARRGERTLWVEMTESPRGGLLFPGFDPRYELTRVNDSLWAMNLRLQPAIEEYLAVAFRVPLITRLIARNTLFQVLTGALPGLDSLIPLGKLWYELRRRRGQRPYWDRIILDAPATGHALAMLRFPQTALDMVSSGNVADRTRDIDAILRDRSLTALIAVTTLDELPVDETGELLGRVHDETPYRFEMMVCNQVLPDIGSNEADRYRRWLAGAADTELDALAAADEPARDRLRALDDRRKQQQSRRIRLEDSGVPMIETPWSPLPGEPERLTAMIEALESR
ncbi:MAG: ArsA-related P-loop ATPase [Wenzhouxiangella sp.]|jgi:anion-transporting  ArsA/GET3 family ATPase|nr:ArsA-related P-loop ATPase [Wenzhouxiangella sp.]